MQTIKRSPNEFNTTTPSGFYLFIRNATQTISFMVGALLVSIGLSEIVVPSFIEMNLSLLHALLIASAGALLIYNGFKSNTHASYLTCLIYGSVFAVLSVVGFVFGERTNSAIRYDATDDHLLNLPAFNALGTFDHGMHAVLAVVLLLGALDWKRHHTSAGKYNANDNNLNL